MFEIPRLLPLACGLTIAAVASPALAGDDDPDLVLQPSGGWQLKYADDSCRLARLFGEGENKTLLVLERYEPGDEFMLVVAGASLGKSKSEKVRYRFGPQ